MTKQTNQALSNLRDLATALTDYPESFDAEKVAVTLNDLLDEVPQETITDSNLDLVKILTHFDEISERYLDGSTTAEFAMGQLSGEVQVLRALYADGLAALSVDPNA